VIETNDCAPDPPRSDLANFKTEFAPTRNVSTITKIECMSIGGPQSVFEISSGQSIKGKRSSILPQVRSAEPSPGAAANVRSFGSATAFPSNQQP
jgi:hypothetical protein